MNRRKITALNWSAYITQAAPCVEVHIVMRGSMLFEPFHQRMRRLKYRDTPVWIRAQKLLRFKT